MLLVCAVVATPLVAQPADPDGESALRRALELADLYNWIDAAEWFEKAASQLGPEKAAEQTIAQCGLLRASMEERSLPELADEISKLIKRAATHAGSRAPLFCTATLGDVDGELDAQLMKLDWDAVRKIAESQKDARLANRAAGEIGLASFLNGDFVAARQLVAGALVKAVELKDAGAQVRFLSAIGNGLALTGNADQALGYFDKATRIVATSPDFGFPFLLETGRLQALRSLRRFEDAEALGTRILTEARARRKFVKEAQTLITLASVAEAQGDNAVSLERLKGAIDLASRGGFPRLAATARVDLADLHRKVGELPEAEELLETALTDTLAGGEAFLMPRRLQSLAQLQIAQGKVDEADHTFERATEIIDGLLGSNPNFSARTALVATLGEVNVQHFSLVADQSKNVSRAFDILESIRGRAVRDFITAGAPAADEGDGIDRQIAVLRLALAKARPSSERRELNEKIFLLDQRRWIAPAAEAAYRIGGAPSDGLGRAQQTLGPDELLLGFVLLDPRSYCIVVSRTTARIVKLASLTELRPLAEELAVAVRHRKPTLSLSRELYSALLEEVDELRAHKQVVVLRDGPLFSVPFDVLRGPDRRMLVQTHSITYAPSADTLRQLRQAPNFHTERKVVALGGVPYDPIVSKIARSRGIGTDGYGNLPGSRDEALLAARTWNAPASRALIGKDATEGGFKRYASGRSSVVHIAAHGVADVSTPDKSAVLLAPDPASGEDGVLQATELAQIRVSSQLVVLSACDTGVGKVQGQEGVANLSRAFLLAGARGVVSTLWTVDDTYTLSLMRGFYRNLEVGQAPSLALANAKRRLLRTFGSKLAPYYWAAFVLEGDGSRPLGPQVP